MTKILVTGGAGFIGSALVRKLKDDGHQVRVLDNFSRGNLSRLPGVTEVIQGDVRDLHAVREAMHGMDTVVHLAYVQGTQTFYAEPREVLDVAVGGIRNILAGCESEGVGDLMLVSSSEAYQVATIVPTPETVPLSVPDPLNPRYSYGGGKIISELMSVAWARTGILDRLIIARPHNIYGPDMGREHVIPEFCLRMNELERGYAGGETPLFFPFPIQGTGKETRSFCYIDDCTAQLALLLERATGTGIFHVGTMDERTIEEVAYAIAFIYDHEIEVIPGSLPKGSPPRRLPDMAKMAALGYEPEWTFEAGLAPTVQWYRDHG
jgi:nucleoside-diphosphate-sugar epimerase